MSTITSDWGSNDFHRKQAKQPDGGRWSTGGIATGIQENAGDGADRALADAADWRGPADPDAGATAESGPRISRRSLDPRSTVSAAGAISDEGVDFTEFSDQLTERLRAVPGVRAVSVSEIHPPSDRWRGMFSIEGRRISRLEDSASMSAAEVRKLTMQARSANFSCMMALER